MDRIEKDIVSVLMHNSGLSDKELSEAIKGWGASSNYVNQTCRRLEDQGLLIRSKRDDGLIGNWLVETKHTQNIFQHNEIESQASEISEKFIKKTLADHLISHGWHPEVSWGNGNSLDIEARMGSVRWVIQVKGSGLFHPVIVNNFLLVIGEIVQRMDDPEAKYSIALPDQQPFHRLWERIPLLVRGRTGITALFVSPDGKVKEEI